MSARTSEKQNLPNFKNDLILIRLAIRDRKPEGKIDQSPREDSARVSPEVHAQTAP